ncbi:hypothetical protein Hypma_005590, partial [Hypsizygus marmoreus]
MDDDDDDTFEDLDIVSEHMPPSSLGSSVLNTSSSLEARLDVLTDFARGIGAYNQSQPILQPWAAASAIEKQLSLIHDRPYSDECAVLTSTIWQNIQSLEHYNNITAPSLKVARSIILIAFW